MFFPLHEQLEYVFEHVFECVLHCVLEYVFEHVFYYVFDYAFYYIFDCIVCIWLRVSLRHDTVSGGDMRRLCISAYL